LPSADSPACASHASRCPVSIASTILVPHTRAEERRRTASRTYNSCCITTTARPLPQQPRAGSACASHSQPGGPPAEQHTPHAPSAGFLSAAGLPPAAAGCLLELLQHEQPTGTTGGSSRRSSSICWR
jgi:hypothetical protein